MADVERVAAVRLLGTLTLKIVSHMTYAHIFTMQVVDQVIQTVVQHIPRRLTIPH
jgi:hypothetical protein